MIGKERGTYQATNIYWYIKKYQEWGVNRVYRNKFILGQGKQMKDCFNEFLELNEFACLTEHWMPSWSFV